MNAPQVLYNFALLGRRLAHYQSRLHLHRLMEFELYGLWFNVHALPKKIELYIIMQVSI